MEAFSAGNSLVVVDGCHNQHRCAPHHASQHLRPSPSERSMRLFVEGLRSQYPRRELWLLFGCGHEKNMREMLGEAMLCDRVLFAKSRHFKAVGVPELLAQLAGSTGAELFSEQVPMRSCLRVCTDSLQLLAGAALDDDVHSALRFLIDRARFLCAFIPVCMASVFGSV